MQRVRVDLTVVALHVMIVLEGAHRGARRRPELAVGVDREQVLDVLDRGALLALVQRRRAALDLDERRRRRPLAVVRAVRRVVVRAVPARSLGPARAAAVVGVVMRVRFWLVTLE